MAFAACSSGENITPTESAAMARLPDSEAGGAPLRATLTGAAEVPGPGDPDGSGSARITINVGRGQLCYELTVSDIAPATMAHVHIGDASVAGPVVVGLDAPTDGSSSGCVSVSRQLAQSILTNARGYYVNVHNAEYPPGAVRGQLAIGN
jgi:hypothetical protein